MKTRNINIPSTNNLNPIIKKIIGLLYLKPPEPNLPELKDIFNFKVSYWLIPGFARSIIKWDPLLQRLIYYVEEPVLSEEDLKILNFLKEKIIEQIEIDLDTLDHMDAEMYIFNLTFKIIKFFGITVDEKRVLKILYYIWRDFLNLGKIEPLMRDVLIEDISCNGVNIPIYVNHSRYGSLRTNIIFKSEKELEKYIVKLAQKAKRYISYAEPLLDATLPDGSRINATYTSDITTRGPTFTIRKFKQKIFTIVDLIKLHTLDITGAAYLWWAVENKANILIAGETASGKTTTLNAIAMMIPPEEKIVSIEDTREIKLFHENWIPAVAREGLGLENIGKVTLFDLLKESFRQRPDYIIVGEIRGKEAYVLFQGMASGHAALSTMHADSLYAIIKRLSTPPINLPEDLINLTDLVVFTAYAKEKGPSARRIRDIIEVLEISKGDIKKNNIYSWDALTDTFNFKKDIKIYNKLKKRRGYITDPSVSIPEKVKVLEYLVKKDITDAKIISSIFSQYYRNKEALFKKIQ